MRAWIKVLPLGLGLPVVIGAASVKPEDAASNIAAWLHLLGMEHLPAWLSAPGVDNRVIFGALSVGAVYAFLVWGVPSLSSGIKKSPLEILYRWNDPKHVQTEQGFYLSSPSHSRYFIEILNQLPDKTIDQVSVTWDKTPFTRFIDGEVRRGNWLQEPISIHPEQKQSVYLFGLDDRIIDIPRYDDVLGHASTFIVRVRGKDAAEISAEFEYSPLRIPKVLRIR